MKNSLILCFCDTLIKAVWSSKKINLLQIYEWCTLERLYEYQLAVELDEVSDCFAQAFDLKLGTIFYVRYYITVD